jgi:hypothetical protein
LYLAAAIPIKSASRPPQPQHYSKNPELLLLQLLLLLILFSPSAFPPEQQLRETTQSSGNWQLQRIHESERGRENLLLDSIFCRSFSWTRHLRNLSRQSLDSEKPLLLVPDDERENKNMQAIGSIAEERQTIIV